jgi:hypothetical protein
MEQYIETDRQTHADLSITQSPYDEKTLCNLFLKTETKPGKSLMLHWITYPLSDVRQIRKRQEAINWNALPELPLNEEELDFIEYYLNYREQIRNSYFLLSVFGQIDRLLKHDPKRYVICRGVKLVVLLMHRLERWRTEIGDSDIPLLLKEKLDTVHSLLHGSELEEVLKQTDEDEDGGK